MIRYWCFDDQALEHALDGFSTRTAEPGVDPMVVRELIREFLVSPEARTDKLLIELNHEQPSGGR